MTWQPSASIENLRQRMALIYKIRNFFIKRGYLEVETPIMAQHGTTDVYLTNIVAKFRDNDYYLQTSPEYHMKRLLAAGSGPIFQMARMFRDDELGRWHNPEFTMLEWYQLNIDHHQLIAEIDDLLQLILNCKPLIKKTYQQVFEACCQVDPFTATIDELRQCLVRFELDYVLPADEDNRDQFLFLLMSHVIEPAYTTLDQPLVIYNFPPSQASLARINNGVAERFEVYIQGVELANGFHELTDAFLQAVRFKNDLELRTQKGLSSTPADPYLLQALEHGLPNCSGVALGIDRLIAIALKQSSITQTLAFDISRA